jgi:hypothetical protein
MRSLLRALAALGCSIEAPPGARDTYVNIARPRPARGRGRLASMHARTGRLEFQGNSWNAAVSTGRAARFDHLAAGNKAAINLLGTSDVEAAVDVARAVLAGRAG